MTNDDSIKRVHKRVDKLQDLIDRLGIIIRGNGDGGAGMRGDIIGLDGRLTVVENHIKETKIWTRGLVMVGVVQVIGIIIILVQMLANK